MADEGSHRMYSRRKPPTASSRRQAEQQRQQRQPTPEPVPVPIPIPKLIIEPVPEAVPEESSFPFPGGPLVPSLLTTYKNHVATSIWNGIERGVLKCNNHTQKLWEWEVGKFDNSWGQLIRTTNMHLCICSYEEVDKVLVTAFVERWHPETNTFHLPFGEMTITLDDVYCLTGLQVIGQPVVTTRVDQYTVGEVAALMDLGVNKVLEGLSGARGSSFKLE